MSDGNGGNNSGNSVGGIGCGSIIFAVIFGSVGIEMLKDEPVMGGIIIAAVVYVLFRKPIRNVLRARKMKKQFGKYEEIIGSYRETPIMEFADRLGVSEDRVITDLQAMIDSNFYSKAFINYENRSFVVPLNSKLRGVSDSEQILGVENMRQECLTDIGEAIDAADSPEMKEKIRKIGSLIDRILLKFEEEPELIEDTYKFKDYYLPKTMNLINNYKEICSVGALDSQEQALKKEIEDFFQVAESAFSKILKKISIDGVYDLSADVSTLNTVFEQEGLTDPDFVTRHRKG